MLTIIVKRHIWRHFEFSFLRYLVDVVGIDACVEAHVEVVEHLHHLKRSTGRRDGGEANDVGEKNGHLEENVEK